MLVVNGERGRRDVRYEGEEILVLVVACVFVFVLDASGVVVGIRDEEVGVEIDE
jgi:hypothetical protein